MFFFEDLQSVQILARLLSLSAAENLGCYHYGFAFTMLGLRNGRWELLKRLTRKISTYASEQGATVAQGCCRAFPSLSWNAGCHWLTWRQEPIDEYYRESFPKANGL